MAKRAEFPLVDSMSDIIFKMKDVLMERMSAVTVVEVSQGDIDSLIYSRRISTGWPSLCCHLKPLLLLGDIARFNAISSLL